MLQDHCVLMYYLRPVGNILTHLLLYQMPRMVGGFLSVDTGLVFPSGLVVSDCPSNTTVPIGKNPGGNGLTTLFAWFFSILSFTIVVALDIQDGLGSGFNLDFLLTLSHS